jgi:hypothetical protein
MPTEIDKATQDHKDKSEFDLVVLREQTKNLSDSSDHQVALALLHKHQVDREMKKMAQTERSLKIAKIGVTVAAIGIFIAVVGVAAHIWSHLTPAASSPSAVVAPAMQTTVSPPTKP